MQDAGCRQVVQVVAGRHRQRALAPPAGHPAEDQPGVQLLQFLWPQTHSFQDAGPEAFEEDVGVSAELA